MTSQTVTRTIPGKSVGIRPWLVRLMGIAALLAVALPAAPTVAQPADPPGPTTAALFSGFLQATATSCADAPARACIDAAYAYLDADGDRGLSQGEMERLRDALTQWLEEQGTYLREQQRAVLALGLVMLEFLGIDRLIDQFDRDRNGSLSQDELLIDVRLDDRPLGDVLLDPDNVDRDALARRIGAMAPMLEPFFAYRPQ